jgi:hypothetical protein
MGRPIYDPNPFKVYPNPLISCRVRVHVELSGRLKIASPTHNLLSLFLSLLSLSLSDLRHSHLIHPSALVQSIVIRILDQSNLTQ